MKLYFLRHATASDNARTDEERELTREGRQEARVMGAALARLNVAPSHILSSPLIRARQTAEIVAEALKSETNVEVFDQLRNDITTTALLRALRPFAQGKSIFLVGHAPSMPHHIATLIGAKTTAGIVLAKGGICCVDMPVLSAGKGQLYWLARQKQLRLIAA